METLFKVQSANGNKLHENELLDKRFHGPASRAADFVRRIASIVDGVQEVRQGREAQMLSFSTSDRSRVNVYYGKRIVGTSSLDLSKGNTQLFRRNCSPSDVAEILRDPSKVRNPYKIKSCTASSPGVHDGLGDSVGDQEEKMLRQELLDCYLKSESLKQQQLALLKRLKAWCDDRRAITEAERLACLSVKHNETPPEESRGDFARPKAWRAASPASDSCRAA